MKNFNFILLNLAAFALASASACQSEGNSVPRWDSMNSEMGHDQIVLGRRLDDPYSVKNMTKALRNLYPTKAISAEPLEPTHYYIRFLPRDNEELGILESLGIQTIDHPMDYEILREGDWYHDPAIPEGRITWQYAAVPVSTAIPDGLVYEKIDNCYITGNEPATKADGIDWAEVEREAFRLSGNETMFPGTKAGDTAKPKGRITILDQDYDSEPVGVSGVKVAANVFVKSASCFTDEEGYFEMDKAFASQPRFRLVFANKKGFCIGVNAIVQKGAVSTLGKKSQAGFELTIDRHSDGRMFERCAINNAAWSYIESCKTSSSRIKAPPSNLCIWTFRSLSRSTAPMLHQGVMIDNDLLASLVGEFMPIVQLLLPDIILGIDRDRSYRELYADTVHQMAHASHFMQAGGEYWNKLMEFFLSSFISSGGVLYGVGTEKDCGYCEVSEMWAFYMESLLHNARYPELATTFGTSYWFSPQILMYLDQKGLSRFNMFTALAPDVHDKSTLRTRLLSLYPEFKNEINQAFNKYN